MSAALTRSQSRSTSASREVASASPHGRSIDTFDRLECVSSIRRSLDLREVCSSGPNASQHTIGALRHWVTGGVN
eukprot:1194042-Prorocentrum_minimum.AAC.4